MLQREVAAQLGVCTPSVVNWEANVSVPEVRLMAAVIAFLGYKPLPETSSLGEQLVRQRTSLGLSRSQRHANSALIKER